MLAGIDISHYQPPMNYTQAHMEGAAFIVHKATEGGGTDPTYAARAASIRASGAVPGAYHFLRSSPSAAEQVDHFLSVIGDPAGLLIQLDWELSGSDLAPISMARAWMAEWNRRTNNHAVLIYLPHWVWADHLGSPPGLNTLGPLWASRYLAEPPAVLTLASANQVPASWWAGYGGWSRPAVLQYAGEAGRIAGVSGADLNLFDGTLADLQALTGGGDMGLAPEEYQKIVEGQLGGDNALYFWLRSLMNAQDPMVQAAYSGSVADLEKAGVDLIGLKQVLDAVNAIKAGNVDAATVANTLKADPQFVQAVGQVAGQSAAAEIKAWLATLFTSK